MRVVNSIFNTPYNWSLVLLTVIIFYLLISPYSSQGNYDMFVNFYNYVIFISAGIYLVALNLKESDKALRQTIVLLSSSTIMLSILSILFVKSIMIPGFFGLITSAISIFMFLVLIKNVNLLALRD